MSSKRANFLSFVFVFGIAVHSSQSESFRGHVYHGIIKEDAVEGDNVDLDSPLYVRNRNGLARAEEICGYTIYKAPADLPFKMVLLEPLTGSAKIVVADGSHVDYEKQHQYSFEIAAHDCNVGSNMSHSERELVLIDVEDVNDNRPEWTRSAFSTEANEGRIYDRLIRLDATDADGSDAFSKICRYHVVTKDVPFEADTNGYIHNTEPLNYQQKQSYVFEVTAEDCGGLLSDPASVTVAVNPVCVPRWTGISDRVDFLVGTHLLMLALYAQLDICNSACNLTEIVITVKLDSNHLERDCDRDTASVESQLKLCGASEEFIDLPSLGSWNQNQTEAEGLNHVLDFDGVEDAILIPVEKFRPDLGSRFTVLTWMKHSENSASGYDKEQILCHSDAEAMNRHHYSIFVHNCHLILLLRRESTGEADMSRFQPTEWRWKLEEVCDGNWHQYAISFDLPEVRLYVDGRRFVETRHNPVIIDDWPLHPTKFVHSTKLVIGACWHGKDHRMGEHFHGQLAGLSILVNATETDQVLHCLHSCQEKLDFTRLDDMEAGTSVSLNSEMSSVTISGTSVHAVQRLLHRVSYINTRTKPVTGHRPLSINSHATCSNHEPLMIATTSILITVVEFVRPTLVLRAPVSHLSVGEDKLTKGVNLFANLSMTLAHSKENDQNTTDEKMNDEVEDDNSENRLKIDSCLVQMDSHLNHSYEYLQFPSGLFSQLGLLVDVSEDGIVISGADIMSSYERALSTVEYVNAQPDELHQRSFTLGCTEWTGQFISNRLDVTLEVIHLNRRATIVPNAHGNDKLLQTIIHKLVKPTKMSSISFNSREIGLGMAIMIVLCVGTLVILTVLGAIKLRTVQGQPGDVGVDDKPEMEWDNSALTITVNPMEQEMYDEPADECSFHGNDTEESEEEEEETTVHENEAEGSEEEEDGEEGETGKVVKRDLEWDDSTLTY